MIKALRLAIAALSLAAVLGVGSVVLTTCGATVAFANDCAAKCQAQENACRRATKDSPSCSAEMTRCLQSCRQPR